MGIDMRLLFLHAYPLNRCMWDGVRAELPTGWQSDALDYPGFGGTQVSVEPPSIGPLAEQSIDWLDQHGPAVLVGLSLGGYTMGEVARRRPDLIRGLVFCDTRLAPDGQDERAHRFRNARRIESEGVEFLVRDYLPNCIGETTARTRPAVVEAASDLIRNSDESGLAWGMRAMANRHDTRDSVRTAGAPGHILVGEEDALCGEKDRADLLAATGGGITVIPRVGHYSALEDAPAFASALVAAVGDWRLRR